MKKEIVSVIAAIMAINCTAGTPLPMPSEIVDPTRDKTSQVEPLEKRLIGIKVMPTESGYVIGLSYDTNNNNLPDIFETYLGHYEPRGDWFHLHELIETTYNEDKGDEL